MAGAAAGAPHPGRRRQRGRRRDHGELLRASATRCVGAKDGLQALHVAGEFRPDVVLLDIGLPLMDGYEVARRLRQTPPTAARC